MNSYTPVLLDLYKRLYNSYIRLAQVKTPKNKYNSIYLAIFHAKSKAKRMRFLQDAAIPITAISGETLDELRRLRLVDLIEKDTRIALTSRGIWEAEQEQSIIDYPRLIDFIDSEYFNCFSETNEDLDNKEKIILFVALAARAISEQSAIDVKDHRFHDEWKKVIHLAFEFLVKNDIVGHDAKMDDIIGDRQTSLHSVINFFRYSERLPKKTNGIYMAKGSKYFLNINQPESLDDIAYLFKLILSGKLNYTMLQPIYDFCIKTSYDVNVKIFDGSKHIFATPDYDMLIYNSLRQALLS